MKRRLVASGVLMCLVALVGAGCGSKDPGGASQKAPIKLGMLVSVTGAASWLGDPEVKGAKLAVAEINAKGGINGSPLELVVVDDESAPEKAVIGAKKLVEQEKVAAIIGTSLVATSKAISPLVKEKGPIAFSLSAGYDPENTFMFAGSVHTQSMQQTIMDWFKSKGFKKVALLATTDSTGQVAVDSIQKVAPAAGVEVVAVERMNATDVDVMPQLTQIRSKKPDAVISWLTGKPAGVVVKNYYQLGMDVPLFLSPGNISYTFVDSIKATQPAVLLMPSTKDVAWENLPADDAQRKLNETFHQKYFDANKQKADYGPPVAYDAVMLVAEAIKKAGTDPVKMKEALETIKDYKGIVATYNFNKDDHRGTGRKDAVLIQVKEGKFSLYWR